MKEVQTMLIDICIIGIAVVVAVDLLKAVVEQTFNSYTPKHGRRRSA